MAIVNTLVIHDLDDDVGDILQETYFTVKLRLKAFTILSINKL